MPICLVQAEARGSMLQPGLGLVRRVPWKKPAKELKNMQKKGYNPRPRNLSWKGGRWGCDLKGEQWPGGRVDGLQRTVVNEPKQLYKKNKISRFLLKTEGKVNCVLTPMFIHRSFLLNDLLEMLYQSAFSLLLRWAFQMVYKNVWSQ